MTITLHYIKKDYNLKKKANDGTYFQTSFTVRLEPKGVEYHLIINDKYHYITIKQFKDLLIRFNQRYGRLAITTRQQFFKVVGVSLEESLSNINTMF